MAQENDLDRIQPVDEVPIVRARYARGYPEGDAQTGAGYGYPSDDDAGSMNFRDILRLIRKRKWMLITTTVIVTSIVALQMYRTPSTYKSTTTIEVDKDTPLQLKGSELVVGGDDADSIKTTMLVIKSDPVLQDTVRQLALDKNPKFLHPETEKPVMEAINELLGRGKKPASGQVGAPEPLPADPNRIDSIAAILDKALTVDLLRDTRALSISYTHTDPEIAALVANGVAQSFMSQKFRGQTEKFTNTSEWLDRSTRELKARVEQAEQALATYTKEHGMFSTDNKGSSLTTDKLTHLHDQATRLTTERMLKQSVYEEVKAGRIADLPETYVDKRLDLLKEKLGQLEADEAQLSARYGPLNPKLVELKHEIAAVRQQLGDGMTGLEEKLQADYERAVRDEQSLNSALAQAKGEAVKENQDAIQYNILKQDVDTQKSLYNDFLQKTSQANLEVAQQHSNTHVIQPAKPPRTPVGPQRAFNIIIAFIASLASGIGLAFVIERLDNTIKTTDDVSRYIQLPALGVIPLITATSPKLLKGKLAAKAKPVTANGQNGALVACKNGDLVMPGLLLEFDATSSAAEAYRALRTSVLLSSAGGPPKTLLITSGQPGEGKTTTTVNTAISLAQLGASVLLIDCDLRKPAVHKVLGVDNLNGVSSYLSGAAPLASLIKKSTVPYLSVLPSGPIPPNPAELLSSNKMKEMLSILAEQYDHILIDSPPLIHVTDPVILSTLSDGVMIVVSWGKSSRDVVRRVRQELTAVGAKIFGVVLNGVDFKREGYDSYYYYKYSAGYGDRPESRTGGTTL